MMLRIVESFEKYLLTMPIFFKNSQSTLVSLSNIVPNCEILFFIVESKLIFKLLITLLPNQPRYYCRIYFLLWGIIFIELKISEW